MHPFAALLLKLSLCAAVAWAMARTLGWPLALVLSSPVLGLALARPILDLLAALRDQSKAAALAPVQGRHFSFHGSAIDVAEDEDEARWLLLRDVRKLLPALTRDAALQGRWGERVAEVPGYEGLRIRADALLEHLRPAQDPQAIRFKLWIERDVLHTHRQLGRS